MDDGMNKTSIWATTLHGTGHGGIMMHWVLLGVLEILDYEEQFNVVCNCVTQNQCLISENR